MSEIQTVLALLLYIAVIVFLLVYIQELRFRIAANKLTYQLMTAVEKLSNEGTMQSAAALTELRRANDKVQLMKESQAKLTMRLLTYVFGSPRK